MPILSKEELIEIYKKNGKTDKEIEEFKKWLNNEKKQSVSIISK